jgi:hypothetical protein
MKFSRCPYKAVAKGITPRRLAAAITNPTETA